MNKRFQHLVLAERLGTGRRVNVEALEPFHRFEPMTLGKRFQASSRSNIPLFEADGPRVKVNPLADWDPGDLRAYMQAHDLPAHPLVAEGYPSIGCMPCTSPVAEGEDPRAGRWRGGEKTECGIHFPLPQENENGAGI